MSNNIIDKIQISGQSYDVKDSSAATVVELTQQEYDNLPSSAKTSNTLFVITDAQAGDLTNYYTKTETNTLLGDKADTATTYTKTEVDNAITAATSTKQDTLVSSQNIKTINNESILGSGNIDIQGGGGKAVSGGTNISITTGETADTINCTLPITATSSPFDTISVGKNSGGGRYNTMIGPNTSCDYSSMYNVFLIAQRSNNSSQGSYVKGRENVIIGSMKTGYPSWDIPSFSTSQSVVIGGGEMSTDKNNSLAIGYNANVSGTTKTNINNQLTIDTSNQVYIYNKDNTEMICLQDHLGGGGGGLDDDTQLLLSTALTDLNDRKIDASEVKQNYQRKGDYATKSELAAKANVSDVMTLEKAKENEQVTSYALNNLNNRVTDNTTALGGMKLVKITESEYAALTTKDENTLYVVIADPE